MFYGFCTGVKGDFIHWEKNEGGRKKQQQKIQIKIRLCGMGGGWERETATLDFFFVCMAFLYSSYKLRSLP